MAACETNFFLHPKRVTRFASRRRVGDISCAASAQLKNTNCKSRQHRRRFVMLLLQSARFLLGASGKCKETGCCRPSCICIIHGGLLIYILFVYFRKCAQEINWKKFRKVASPPTDRCSRFPRHPRDFRHNLKWLFAFLLRHLVVLRYLLDFFKAWNGENEMIKRAQNRCQQKWTF